MSLEQVIGEIKKEYPDLEKARALCVQGDFLRAAEQYTNLLNEMASNEKEDSLKLAAVYIEYARALMLSNDRLVINPDVPEDMAYLDDLEIAWEVLEISKGVFKKNGMKDEEIEVHLLLSDISQESNNHTESKVDLEEALKLSEELSGESTRTAEIAFRLAVVEEALGRTGEAKALMGRVLEIIKKQPQGVGADDLVAEVQERVAAMENPDKYRVEIKQEAKNKAADGVVRKIPTRQTAPQEEQKTSEQKM